MQFQSTQNVTVSEFLEVGALMQMNQGDRHVTA